MRRPKKPLWSVFSCEEIGPLLYAYQVTLSFGLVMLYAALRTKPLEHKSVADQSEWFAALVTALGHDLPRSGFRNCWKTTCTRVLPSARTNATAFKRQPYKVWLRFRPDGYSAKRLTRHTLDHELEADVIVLKLDEIVFYKPPLKFAREVGRIFGTQPE